MDFKQLEFVTAVIGSVAERLGLPLATVYRRLKDSNIIDGYLVPGYDPLHTFSREYFTDDVIDFMKEKGVPLE
ncbi:MAG: DUF3791 domain-containing protein [Bacteroidales bacterium]|nr:DUF3791 domain-containing protein [Bacteroidales bacterium]